MASSVDIRPILLETSEKYHIEYNRFLSNHIAHGILALAHLGATKERIQEFVDWYGNGKLESKTDPQYEREFGKEGEDFSDISKVPVGTRTRYYPILNLIEKQIKENGGDYRKVVAEHFPKVSDALACSLLHGIIQLGYGIAADCAKTVAEGIAYMYHSYVSAYMSDPETDNSRSIGNFGKGTTEPLDVLQKIKEDKELTKAMEETFKTEDVQCRDVGALQQRIIATFISSGKKMQNYADSVKLPDHIDVNNLDVEALGTWIVDLMLTLYTTSEVKNDFVILHAVTSAWSLKQILPIIADQKQEVLRAARTFIITALAVYVARGCYKFNLEELKGYPDQVDEAFWTKLNTEQAARVCDEHYYKLVQVAYDMWKVNPKNSSLYVAGAKHCMENDLYLLPTIAYPKDDRKAELTTRQIEKKLFSS